MKVFGEGIAAPVESDSVELGKPVAVSHHHGVARQATIFGRTGLSVRRVLINGAAGMVAERQGKPFSVGAFTVKNGKIVECDFLVDPDRIAQLDLNVLDD